MYIKQCKICGKTIEVKHKNYCICSDECRKINIIRSHKEYSSQEEYKEKQRELKRKKYKDTHRLNMNGACCLICGILLENGHQKYCMDCIIKEIKSGDMETRARFKQILVCRGYNKELIDYEINMRGR